MKAYAFLQYGFIFEPSESWAHSYQFEKELGDYFAACGYEASPLKQIDGSSGVKIFILRKIPDFVVPTNINPQKGRPLSVQGKVNQLRATKVSAPARDYRKGKMLTRKGYLKRENG